MELGSSDLKTARTAEEMRIKTEAARQLAQVKRQESLQELERHLDTLYQMQYGTLLQEVEEAASQGLDYASIKYTERISRSRVNSAENKFIEALADDIANRVVARMTEDGFDCYLSAKEDTDYPQTTGATPDLYVNTISVKW